MMWTMLGLPAVGGGGAAVDIDCMQQIATAAVIAYMVFIVIVPDVPVNDSGDENGGRVGCSLIVIRSRCRSRQPFTIFSVLTLTPCL